MCSARAVRLVQFIRVELFKVAGVHNCTDAFRALNAISISMLRNGKLRYVCVRSFGAMECLAFGVGERFCTIIMASKKSLEPERKSCLGSRIAHRNKKGDGRALLLSFVP